MCLPCFKTNLLYGGKFVQKTLTLYKELWTKNPPSNTQEKIIKNNIKTRLTFFYILLYINIGVLKMAKQTLLISCLVFLFILMFSIRIMRMQIEYKKLQIIETLQQQVMQEIKIIKGVK